MANAIDFIGTLYNTLAKTLNLDNGSNAELIQMAWPGYALSPLDFKAPDAPNGPYDAELAKEAFSHIANIAPALNKLKFENSGFEVDDLYEILLSSAIPLGATQESLTSNPLFKLFSDAQYEFLQARRGCRNDPNLFYYPCNATPANWYDEAASAFWPVLEIKSTQVEPAAPGKSLFVKAGGLEQAKKGMWKLRPGSKDEVSIRKDVEQTLMHQMQVQKPPPVVKAGALIMRSKPLGASVLAASKASIGSQAKALPPGGTRSATFVSNLHLVQAASVFNVKNLPVNVLANPALQLEARQMNLATRAPIKRTVLTFNLAHRFLLKDVIEKQLPDVPVASASDGFSLSFKYCRVNIDRSWFKLALLTNKNWSMFNTAAQEYSSGRLDDNQGIFPLLPTSFIVIRDLKITANWSGQDQLAMQNSISFGPFDLTGSVMQQNSLQVKGMQIIAWVSKATPPLPPGQMG